MSNLIIDCPENIVLVGAGEVTDTCLIDAMKLGSTFVAADGGAGVLVSRDLSPDAVIGDFDSLSPEIRNNVPRSVLHHVPEQDTTDFEKCMSRIRAPLLLGVGFLGRRVDHQLAVLNVLVRYVHQPCILLGTDDVIFAAPVGQLHMSLPVGTRVSLFPLMTVRGKSEGLEWPIAGLTFAPGAQIGTSNRSTGPVALTFDEPGMLVILPRDQLQAAVTALTPDGFGLL